MEAHIHFLKGIRIEKHFLGSSGNAKIIIGLHLVSSGSFSLGIAFG